MFHLLDKTLKEMLLHDPAPGGGLAQLRAADVTFTTPDKRAVSGDTVNLFLYEVRENRELRNAAPLQEIREGIGSRRRPPLRVDCLYLVTAWSMAATPAQQVENEHRLLGQALDCLSRHPVIVEAFLAAGGLAQQVIAPPTMVAQLDGGKSSGEFWTALGIAPRPFFHVLITIAFDFERTLDDALVTSIHTRTLRRDAAGAEVESLIIGGTVRDRDGHPVPDAWVLLEPTATVVLTDAAGRFVFDRAPRGSGYTLRARASGHPEITRPDLELPSLSGEYDLAFP